MKLLGPVLRAILLVLLSSILIFSIARWMPLSPEEMLLSSYNLEHTEENLVALRHKWGLDKPLHIQYFQWLKGLARGDWGNSLISSRPIKDELIKRLPYSFTIGVGSLFLTSVLAFFLGYLAALKQGIFELISRSLALLSQAIPVFISALFIVYFLGVAKGWFKFFTGSPWVGVVVSIILMSLSSCGGLSRLVRAHFLELQNKSYMKRLYTHGIPKGKLYLKHGTKPVLYGMIGALIPMFSSVLGGASVLEFVFGVPGISFFLIESIKNRDYNVIQAYLFLVMLWMFLVQIIFRSVRLLLDRRFAV